MRVKPSAAWRAAWFAPWTVFAVFMMPGLGEYGEGLWPEWFAPELVGTDSFGELATQITTWSVGTLLVVTAIAVALHVWLVREWRVRLKSFDVGRVLNHRSFVWKHVPMAFAGGCAVAVFAVFIAEPLREADPAGWTIFVAAAGAFGALQLLAFVFGTPASLRLYRGR